MRASDSTVGTSNPPHWRDCERACVTSTAMRHICIAAILAITLSGSAVAQSLRPSYSPDGTSQSARPVPPKQSAAHAAKPFARQFSAAPRSEPAAAAQTQGYATHGYGVQRYGAVAPQAAPRSAGPGI